MPRRSEALFPPRSASDPDRRRAGRPGRDGRLRALDWRHHDARMIRLLRLHYGDDGVELVAGDVSGPIADALRDYLAGGWARSTTWRSRRSGPCSSGAYGASCDDLPGATLSYGPLARRLRRPDACAPSARQRRQPDRHRGAVSPGRRLRRRPHGLRRRARAQALAARARGATRRRPSRHEPRLALSDHRPRGRRHALEQPLPLPSTSTSGCRAERPDLRRGVGREVRRARARASKWSSIQLRTAASAASSSGACATPGTRARYSRPPGTREEARDRVAQRRHAARRARAVRAVAALRTRACSRAPGRRPRVAGRAASASDSASSAAPRVGGLTTSSRRRARPPPSSAPPGSWCRSTTAGRCSST